MGKHKKLARSGISHIPFETPFSVSQHPLKEAVGEVYCDKTLSDSEPPKKLALINQGRQLYQMFLLKFHIVIIAL